MSAATAVQAESTPMGRMDNETPASSPSPQQAKIGDIKKLRAGQRMNFIKAVGEVSEVLTHDQHQALIGTMPAKTK